MKRIVSGSLVLFICLASVIGFCFAQDTAKAFKKPAEAGTLSDEDVTALKQSYTDAKLKKSWQWSGGFSTVTLKEKEKEKALKLNKIPYRLTAALYETKEISGKKTSTRASGTCWFYIKDADGKVVHKRSQNLNKMCPS